MWLMIGLRRVLLGFWRLLVGMVIGAILYIWMFFNYKSEWEDIHETMHDFLGWLMSSSYLADYSQWNTLLNLDDKLAFALFIMVGRIIWLMFESIFISFPYWLIFGRGQDGGSSGGGRSMTLEQKSQAAAQGLSDKLIQSASAGATVIPAALATAPASAVSVGLEELGENANHLEHSIDDALERIKNVSPQA